jgi:hypothetical protein
MSQSISVRQAAIVVISLAIMQFALQASLLTRGVEYLATSLTIDDTYYYLQTAWNTKQLGFVTFDGLHSTNGVQLLWFVVIFLLALLAKTKTALLVATLAVSFLLNSLCYLFILRIGIAVKRPALALFIAGLWALQSLPFRIYSTGMENSLHALVFWCVIWQSLVFIVRVQNRENPNFWGLTAALILNAWTRLDSALLSAILYLFCMVMLANAHQFHLRTFLQRHTRVLAGSTLLAGAALLTQLTAFRLMSDSFLPVSAVVKTSGTSRGLGAAAANKLVEVFELGMPSILQGRLPTLVMLSLGTFAILLLVRAQFDRLTYPDDVRPMLSLWSCLAIGELVYYTYVAVSGVEYTPYFLWYRSPSFIFWIVTLSLIAFITLERIERAKLIVNIPNWAPLGISLLSIGVAVYMFARSLNFTSNLYTARYHAALWIAQNLPSGTTFAAWNAGQLGYFSNRPFINLDGVINNVDYYERVLHGSTPLASYLVENKVDYIVDYAIYAAMPNYPVVQTFPVADSSGRSIQVWRVAPQVSLGP